MELPKAKESMSLAEKWIFYKRLEDYAKNEKKKLEKATVASVEDAGGFSRTEYGSATVNSRTNRKATDDLKFYLDEKGYLDICQKDDIDIKKVDELIDAGILDKEEVYRHIEESETKFLKFGK